MSPRTSILTLVLFLFGVQASAQTSLPPATRATNATLRERVQHPPIASTPAPPDVRLISVDGVFRVEWNDARGAIGYVLYVGASPSVGPSDHVLAVPLPVTNCWVLDALEVGETYYVAIASVGLFGEGATSAPATAVFGPKGIVSGDVVSAAPLGGGATFAVRASGATVSLVDAADPTALPIEATADEDGHFRFDGVLEGTYTIGWQYAGAAGFTPMPVVVTEAGVAIAPLEIPVSGNPAETLVGTLTLESGEVPRFDAPELGLHEHADVHVTLANGTELVTAPDRLGRWVLTGVPADGYPLTAEGTYQGLTTSVQVPTPPAALAPIELRFADILPRALRITAFQGGAAVSTVASGQPVTLVAEIENVAGLPLSPCWIAELNGEVQLSTDFAPTFTFEQPAGPPGTSGFGDPLDSGLVRIRFFPAKFSVADGSSLGLPIVAIPGVGCWSGRVGAWDPDAPLDILAAHPATVTVTHSGPLSPDLAATTAASGGYFEMPLNPVSVPPYLVRVDKPDHMRFLWPFEDRLPLEAQFCVVPADGYSAMQSDGGSEIAIRHSSGAILTFPVDSLLDAFGFPWHGEVSIRIATFYFNQRRPWPPNPELRVDATRNGIHVYGGVWFDVSTTGGAPLFPTSAAKLVVPQPTSINVVEMPGYHQVESTGYFEPWGYPTTSYPAPDQVAHRVAAGQYELPLGEKGLFLIGFDTPVSEVFITADRSIGYPFDLLSRQSIFPFTVRGPFMHDLGRLFLPQAWGDRLDVLDLRQAPGMHFADVAGPGLPIEPMRKSAIVYGYASAATPTQLLQLSLASSEPNLKTLPSDTTVTGITSPTHFLSRGGVDTSTDALDYYTRIQAPPTLGSWRALNGFPAHFGDALETVAPDDYATAYYYNLGDLGFARAQTMRVKPGSDGEPDVAFAVTNYRSIDDAICGRGSIATVCMDYAARRDLGQTKPTRYTRFYVYGSNGDLLECADLDGAGTKCVPNLCVVCHGGKPFQAGDPSTNLGSRFLPFDLEAYSFHPKFGVQHVDLARMNAGVLKTDPTEAVQDLIFGWYGSTDPSSNPLAFDGNYVPTATAVTWSANSGLYSDVFEASCRVCHISRETAPGVQFATLASFQGFGYGQYPACTSLQMPHAQRTWGVFWGSRCAANLGASVADMPTLLGGAAGGSCR